MQAVKEMAKTVRNLAHRHSQHNVFSDFVEMSAIALSNAVDWNQREKREARYMEIVGKYKKEEVDQFPKLMGQLVEGLEAGPDDILGNLFHELELHNTYKGQFFTPYHLCRMMAKMTVGEGEQGIIAERGFITAQEPACGAGAMVIALAEELKSQDINYQQQLHVTAIDLDIRCVHMAYVQFSLLHIPAVVVHGNSLSLEEFSHWYTPAHILGLWDYKLKNKNKEFNQDAKESLPEHPVKLVDDIQPITTTLQLTLF
ncbi:N-6 DNA methylase [Rufibacter sediminis]|uniref:SAM-dependent DNA methyltransferase n=1 Tax=Rufibacter sediminis TaxID=2762756 RepID=A0ABR6VTU0_9BACT|nr:N-6 DNA methylase [Rufibacter sediminis]MBC3540632.1 SAM-dependent DNA methyltransferase [Rufibacter sediminis]